MVDSSPLPVVVLGFGLVMVGELVAGLMVGFEVGELFDFVVGFEVGLVSFEVDLWGVD